MEGAEDVAEAEAEDVAEAEAEDEDERLRLRMRMRRSLNAAAKYGPPRGGGGVRVRVV